MGVHRAATPHRHEPASSLTFERREVAQPVRLVVLRDLWKHHFETTRQSATGSLAVLFYNLLLVAVVVITFWLNPSSSRTAIALDSILWLFLLAVLANVAYCAAYVVDLFVQASAFRSHWQQFRWLLFALGKCVRCGSDPLCVYNLIRSGCSQFPITQCLLLGVCLLRLPSRVLDERDGDLSPTDDNL